MTDCNHPKTVEDFYRQRTPDSAKLQRSETVSEIPKYGDRNWRCTIEEKRFPLMTDCNHPKTVEDFYRQRTPDSAKLQRSAIVSEIPKYGDRN
ncbi:hypothetical protein Tco_0762063 [Tanacetum coccineum]